MGNVNAHYHGFAFSDNAKFGRIQSLISPAKFEVELERYISKILIISVLCKLGSNDTDITQSPLDVANKLDLAIDRRVIIGQNHEKQIWWRSGRMTIKPGNSSINFR